MPHVKTRESCYQRNNRIRSRVSHDNDIVRHIRRPLSVMYHRWCINNLLCIIYDTLPRLARHVRPTLLPTTPGELQ